MFVRKLFLSVVLFSFWMVSSCEAMIFITEILPNPSSASYGDANQDGSISSSQDEFIEVWNFSSTSINISGWILQDAVKTRHQFVDGTMLGSLQTMVVFGGGTSSLTEFEYQMASSGGLGLNNTGDSIFLYDNEMKQITTFGYTAVNSNGKSLEPLITGLDQELLGLVEFDQGLSDYYSLGSITQEQVFYVEDNMPLSTPEPSIYVTFLLGFFVLILFRLSKFSLIK